MPDNVPSNPAEPSSAKKPEKKPWPLSWVVIAILAYLLFQTAWIVFSDSQG